MLLISWTVKQVVVPCDVGDVDDSQLQLLNYEDWLVVVVGIINVLLQL